MKENVIKLNKENTLRLDIETADGVKTGEYLEFDLEDIELPLKYQELVDRDEKNKSDLKKQIAIINKRQDVKGKGLLTRNQEDQVKAIQKFFDEEIKIYDIFLGEGGVRKLLNGRKIGWTTLQEIDEIIEKQIAPNLDITMQAITEKIKNKYSRPSEKKENDIEVVE